MKSLGNVLFWAFVVAGIVLYHPNTGSAISLPWSTTFNCDDWVQGQTLNCDGVAAYGAWKCSGSGNTSTVINAGGNNSFGPGGKGARMAVGDGSNNGSAELAIYFDSPQPELWIRFYMRYAAGFTWSSFNYNKLIYLFSDNTSGSGSRPVFDFEGWNNFGVYTYGGSSQWYKCLNCGWQSMIGGTVSNGQWHFIEIHAKMDTNGSNGIAEGWIDGVKKFGFSNVGYGTAGGWKWLQMNTNQASPSNGGCVYIDIDDIAISSSAYIGPVNGAAPPVSPIDSRSAKPRPPTGLR